MAIRLRAVDGRLIAICAARSIEQPGDVYIDDVQHRALGDKFARDFNEMFALDIPCDDTDAARVEMEESNNPSREEWDRVFGNPPSSAARVLR
jgi:hypothetical protein